MKQGLAVAEAISAKYHRKYRRACISPLFLTTSAPLDPLPIMQAKLIVVGGKANKGTVAVELPATIGRSRDADLTVGHRMISRKHCEAYLNDGLMMIRDVGSLNGVYVRGKRVKEAPLPPGAKFTIGPITFRVDYEYSGDTSNLPPAVPAEDAAAVNQTPHDPINASTEATTQEPVIPEPAMPEIVVPEPDVLDPVIPEPEVVTQDESSGADEDDGFAVLGEDEFELAVEEEVEEAPKDASPEPTVPLEEPAEDDFTLAFEEELEEAPKSDPAASADEPPEDEFELAFEEELAETPKSETPAPTAPAEEPAEDDFELAIEEELFGDDEPKKPEQAPTEEAPKKDEPKQEKDPEDQFFDDFLSDL
jgi:hypothetical protein